MHDAPPSLLLDHLTNRQVLQRINEVSEELARRRLIQSLTSSPVGGYAEFLVARHFATQPLKGRDDGFDVIRPDTNAKVQVKARRHGLDRRKTHFGDFGMLEHRRFDEFIGVVFAWDWSIAEAWRMPWDTVKEMTRIARDKHRLYFTAIRKAEKGDELRVEAFDLRDDD